MVPAALVLPAKAPGIDLRYVGGQKEQIYEMMPPDELHVRLRHFAKHVLGAQPYRSGDDDFNLTPSPWIGSFDVLTADAPTVVRRNYLLLVYLDAARTRKGAKAGQQVLPYTGQDADSHACIAALKNLPGCHAEGEVGCAQALTEQNQGLVGLFNNSGVTKRNGRETADPAATKQVVVRGISGPVQYVVGEQFVSGREADRVTLAIPAGEVVVLLLPNGRCLSCKD
jgi:hypothetical protein